MPHGFFTIEQWGRPAPGADWQWLPVEHLNGNQSLSDAYKRLEYLNEPGFYRVVQTQRTIWAQRTDGRLHLRKWHAGSPEDVARTAEAFVRDGGRRPHTPHPEP